MKKTISISNYPSRAEMETRLRNMTDRELIDYIDSRPYSTVAESELAKRLLEAAK